jgi:hypothetical protein
MQCDSVIIESQNKGKLMVSGVRESRAVADRVTIDIEGLREAIADAHADNPLWKELSLSQQIRKLLSERLDSLGVVPKSEPEDTGDL